jgi:hypothetical protein
MHNQNKKILAKDPELFKTQYLFIFQFLKSFLVRLHKKKDMPMKLTFVGLVLAEKNRNWLMF